MPTYEYACDACEHRFDELQSFSDKPLKKCPQCGKPKLRRLLGTGAAILFKGSGFYQTDYRSESYKQAAKADKEPSSGDGKADTSGASSKTGGSGKTKGASGKESAGKSSSGGT